MVKNTSEIGIKIKNKDKEFIIGQMEMFNKDFGKMIILFKVLNYE